MKHLLRNAAIGALGAASIPALALAATQSTLSSTISLVVGLISQALVLLIAVAVIIFVVQVIRYFILPNENRKGAGLYVLYSVIGFFVVLSMWGLVRVVSNTFNLGDTSAPSWSSLSSIFPQ